jgi:hypothetical protein
VDSRWYVAGVGSVAAVARAVMGVVPRRVFPCAEAEMYLPAKVSTGFRNGDAGTVVLEDGTVMMRTWRAVASTAQRPGIAPSCVAPVSKLWRVCVCVCVCVVAARSCET